MKRLMLATVVCCGGLVFAWIYKYFTARSVDNYFVVASVILLLTGLVVLSLCSLLQRKLESRAILSVVLCLLIIVSLHMSGAVCMRKKNGGCIPVVDDWYEFWIGRTDSLHGDPD